MTAGMAVECHYRLWAIAARQPLFDHLIGRYPRNGALWNIGPVVVSLRLDAGRPDHLCHISISAAMRVANSFGVLATKS